MSFVNDGLHLCTAGPYTLHNFVGGLLAEPCSARGSGQRRNGRGEGGRSMVPADVAWMLVSTALVLLMTPALAFFYGGLVRSKNALNTMMMSFIALGFAGVAWALAGYSLAFAPGNGFIGGLSRVALRGVGLEPNGTIP